jgi:hypothetical protein
MGVCMSVVWLFIFVYIWKILYFVYARKRGATGAVDGQKTRLRSFVGEVYSAATVKVV